ncbi:hypothetical protein PR048_016143 [Dryococelus australis]|uniref:Uncharacterized protein n=1 Tax=Dryococelus australis TaxID=614101 RepID=A0ABQ9HJH4_9NEOP|nr:hypothetical protein PR048_016143 [Dryococelus australis]
METFIGATAKFPVEVKSCMSLNSSNGIVRRFILSFSDSLSAGFYGNTLTDQEIPFEMIGSKIDIGHGDAKRTLVKMLRIPPFMRGPRWCSGQTTCLPPRHTGFESCEVVTRFLHVGIVLEDDADLLIFSGFSHFPYPCIPALLHAYLTSPTLTPKIPIGCAIATFQCLGQLHQAASCRTLQYGGRVLLVVNIAARWQTRVGLENLPI